MTTNTEFQFSGFNHLALVSSDMARTVDFYTNVLGMPLIKTLEIPGGAQHFFFDCGNNDSLAFFWFPDAPAAVPGISAAGEMPGDGSIVSAHGSMNHVAFDVPADKFDEYVQKLKDKGVGVSPRAQPRRQRVDRVPRAAPRRVRALGVLPRSRRRAARVRVLDQDVRPRGREPRPGERQGRARPARQLTKHRRGSVRR